VRAISIPLEGDLPPAQAALWLRGERRPFALIGEWAGGGALLGSSPVLETGPDPFAALADLPEVDPGDAVVGGGWFGVLGYRLGELIEALPPPPPAPVQTPAASLAFYDHVVRWDGRRWWFEALSEDAVARHLERWQTRLRSSPDARPFATGAFAARAPSEAGHLDAVAAAVQKIAEGELFQANVTLRLETTFDGDAVDLFAAAIDATAPRFGAFFDGVVSLSPERFLRRTGRHVETDPIKGTSRDREALAASDKDAAEHVMIVDLMRNDLGRVCEYGSVAAHPPRIEPYGDIFHLVSTVSGTLREDATDADLLRATFPPGSVTGAPKVQAMKVITQLEPTRREAYTGAIGYASPITGLELSVAIRTFELAAGGIWLGAGGGIVADSTPGGELAEALEKAAGPIAAVGGRLHTRPAIRAPRHERALNHGVRPDPRAGLLETIRVCDGTPQLLDEHLARLATGARELYGVELPGGLRVQVAHAAQTRPGRVRIVLRPDGTADVEPAPLGPDPHYDGIRPFLLPGGLGAHKWADRRLVRALEGAAAGALPLLVDADGAVLESTWANVVLDEGGTLVTPAADGRILPGVRRGALNAREEPIDLERLAAADAVLLTSALRVVTLAQGQPQTGRRPAASAARA
jgi:para-aminobenzoate synthetase/4-amino-4-deoxychorismate lyase